MISPDARKALEQLDAGQRMNTMHTIARELIAAGLATSDWGVLEITEQGRRQARRYFTTDDDNVANLAGFELAPPAPPQVALETVQREYKPPAQPEPQPQTASQELTWSRNRAAKAAGIANGKTNIWVASDWVDAFIKAYEQQ